MKICLLVLLIDFFILNKITRKIIGAGRVNREKPNPGCPNNKKQ